MTSTNQITSEKEIIQVLKSMKARGANLCDGCPMLKFCPGCKNKIQSRVKYWSANKK